MCLLRLGCMHSLCMLSSKLGKDIKPIGGAFQHILADPLGHIVVGSMVGERERNEGEHGEVVVGRIGK